MPIYTCTRTVLRKNELGKTVRQECGDPATDIVLMPGNKIMPRCKNHISVNKRLSVSSFGQHDSNGKLIPVECVSEEDAVIYEVMKS
jgi:hypothetical protein